MALTGRYSNPADPLRRLADMDLCTDSPAEAGVTREHRAGRCLGADGVADLVARYEAGATVRELAERFGIHRVTVTAQLQRVGIPTRKAGLGADQAGEVMRLYEQGWSARKLAKNYEVSDHTIAAELRRAGVRLRRR